MWTQVPQKVIEKQPIYERDVFPNHKQKCEKCYSTDVFMLFNTIGSPFMCMKCKHTTEQKIVGYKDVIVEKIIN